MCNVLRIKYNTVFYTDQNNYYCIIFCFQIETQKVRIVEDYSKPSSAFIHYKLLQADNNERGIIENTTSKPKNLKKYYERVGALS